MTPEQAMIIIGNLDCDNYKICESQEAKAMAIEALEKQIPHEVTHIGYNYSIGYHIGDCKCGEMVRSLYAFCPDCGQKLEWEESE